MKNYLFVFVLFIVVLFMSLEVGQAATIGALKINTVSTYTLWTTTSLWSSGTVPTSADEVFIQEDGTNVIAHSAINVLQLYMGYITEDKVAFITDSSITANYLQVDDISTMLINGSASVVTIGMAANSTGWGQFTIGGHLTVKGKTTVTGNTGSVTYVPGPNGIIDNYGTFMVQNSFSSDNSTTITHYAGSVFNSTYKYQQSGTVTFVSASGGFTAATSLFVDNCILVVNQSTIYSTSGAMQFQDSTSVKSQGSTFNMVAPSFSKSNNVATSHNFTFFDTSNAQFTNTTFNLNGIYFRAQDSSTVTITNSTINTNMRFAQFNNSKVNMINTNYYSTDFIALKDYGNLTLQNSYVQIKNSILQYQNYSSTTFINSKMEIVVTDNTTIDYSTVGLFDNSQLIFQNSSSLLLDGVFVFFDSTSATIDSSSSVNVEQNLYIQDNAACTVKNSGSIIVQGYLAILDNALLTVQTKGNITVSGFLQVQDASRVVMTNSYLNVAGKFVLLSDAGVYYNDMNNSQIVVNGNFSNYGTLRMDTSSVIAASSFTNYETLIAVNTNFTVQKGLFDIQGSYNGKNTTITVMDGLIKVQSGSTFVCTSCNLVIYNGDFVHSSGSNINITNTKIINIGGTISSAGVIYLDNGEIQNDSDFDLSSSILPSGGSTSASVVNNGKLTVSSGSPVRIQPTFTNNGDVSVQQNITIDNFTQNSGSTVLTGTSLSSASTVVVNGGKIDGNGDITANVSSSGSVGSTSSSGTLNIQGTYDQSESGNMVVTIGTDSNSVLNINSTASLNGTLTVRVDESLIANGSTNTSSQVINYSTASGNFSKVVLVTYNRDTGEEKVVSNPCRVQTSQQATSFSVLLVPESDDCQNSSGEESKSSSSKKIPVALVAGLVGGCVGAVIIVVTLYFTLRKTGRQNLAQKLNVMKK